MAIALFFLSIAISMGTIIALRFIDRNNRNFEKIHKMSRNIIKEINDKTREKFDEIKSFDNDVDYTLNKGKELLAEVKSSVSSMEKRFSSLANEKEKINSIFTKTGELDGTVGQINERLKELEASNNLNKSAHKMLKESFSEMKQLKGEIVVYRNDIEALKNDVITDMDRYSSQFKGELFNTKNEIADYSEEQQRIIRHKFSEIHEELELMESNVNSLKSGFFERVEEDFSNLEKVQKERIHEIRDDMTRVEKELKKDLEGKINDYSNYIVRLEQRAENFSNDILKDLKEEKAKYLLDFKETYTSMVDEMNKNNEMLKAAAKNSVVKTYKEYEKRYKDVNSSFKTFINESDSKIAYYEGFLDDSAKHLEKLKSDVFSAIEEKQKDFQLHIDNVNQLGEKLELEAFKELKAAVDTMKTGCNERIDAFRESVDSRVSKYEDDIDSKYRSAQNMVNLLEQEFTNKKSEYADYKDEVDGMLNTLESRQKGLGEEFDRQMKEFNYKLENETAHLEKLYSTTKEQVTEDIRKIISAIDEEKYRYKDELYQDLAMIKDEINNNSQKLKDYIAGEKDKLFDSITDSFKRISGEADDKTQDMEKRFDLKYEEVENKLLNTQSGLVEKGRALETRMLEEGARFHDEIRVKQSEIKRTINGELKTFEEGLLASKQELEDELNGFVSNVGKTMESLEARVEKGSDELKLLETNILRSKEECTNMVGRLEVDTKERIEEFKNNILRMRETFKEMDGKYDALYNEKIEDIDRKFDNKLDMYNEKFKIHVNELYDRTDVVENDFVRKLDAMESEFSKNGEALLSANRERLDDYYKRFNALEDTLNSLKIRLDMEIDKKIDDGKVVLAERYRELESETIKEINEYQAELAKIKQAISHVDERYEQSFNSKSAEIDSRLEDKLSSIESEFNRRGGEMLEGNSKRLGELVESYEGLAAQIGEIKANLEGELTAKVAEGRESINEILQSQVASAMDNYRQTEGELATKLEEYKNDYQKIQKNMKQIDDKFTARYLEHASTLDKRISDIESEMKKLERSTGMLDKVNNMKERLNDELKNIKSQMDEIKQFRLEIVELEKKMVKIDSTAEEVNDKYSLILNNKKKLENVEAVINELREISDQAQDKVESIKEAKIMINNLEGKIDIINTQCEALERTVTNMTRKDEELKVTIDNFNEVKNNAENLQLKYNLLNKKFDDIDFKRATFEKSFKEFEQDASIITKSQSKVADVMDKFNQMDGLIEDLEIRTESINKIREWLVKAETQIENLNFETDRKIKLLESLINKTGDSPAVKNSLSDESSKKELVLQLQSQGWTIDDIARTLNLSMGEVEFILDLELNSRKN